MLKTQSGRRQREKLKNARATARSMHQGTEGHVREVVEEPAHGPYSWNEHRRAHMGQKLLIAVAHCEWF